MKLYQLLWHLLKHALHGRFRDEVCVSIDWALPHRSGSVTGTVTDFRWESNADAFCLIDAKSEDGPWSEWPEPLTDAPTVPDETVDRFVEGYRKTGWGAA